MANTDVTTKKCSVEGCARSVRKNGPYCGMHYMRLYTHGDVGPAESYHRKTCSVEGCEKKHDSGGYCSMHHWRFQQNGDPGITKKISRNIFIKCKVDGCERRFMSNGFCDMHAKRNKISGDPGQAMPSRSRSGFGTVSSYGYHLLYNEDGKQRTVHRGIVEKAMGKPLPAFAIIHHVDGNKLNNAKDNLVVCQDRAYHNLIHARTDAFDACGHADWRKCKFCKQYDDPKNTYIKDFPVRISYHSHCVNEYHRKSAHAKQKAMVI